VNPFEQHAGLRQNSKRKKTFSPTQQFSVISKLMCVLCLEALYKKNLFSGNNNHLETLYKTFPRKTTFL
jgi:hypothetical protein